MNTYNFSDITISDIPGIGLLQPEGWTDIQTAFRFYISAEFCFPVKIRVGRQICGTGNLICFGQTAWLSHIIVSKDLRNKGIGLAIVNKLLDMAKSKNIQTVSLFATSMGEPVYLKAGFEVVCAYKTLRSIDNNHYSLANKNISNFSTDYYQQLLDLDRRASGENREPIIRIYLNDCKLYIENDFLKGYYLPHLNEGLIVADNEQAGWELLNLKIATSEKVIIPEVNHSTINLLLNNGFADDGIKGKRMIFGEKLEWKPEMIFNRIGGNLG